MTQLELDANGFPKHGYLEAEASAAELFREMYNDWSTQQYLNQSDAEWIVSNVCRRFFSELVRVNHARSLDSGVLRAPLDVA